VREFALCDDGSSMLQSILKREFAHREEFPRLKEIPDEG
jgi:hypothetical protein